MFTYDEESAVATQQVGDMILRVWFTGREDDGRKVFGWSVHCLTVEDTEIKYQEGEDLKVSPIHCGEEAVGEAMAVFIVFLDAAAETYRLKMNFPAKMPDSMDLFNSDVNELAYMNSIELGQACPSFDF